MWLLKVLQKAKHSLAFLLQEASIVASPEDAKPEPK